VASTKHAPAAHADEPDGIASPYTLEYFHYLAGLKSKTVIAIMPVQLPRQRQLLAPGGTATVQAKPTGFSMSEAPVSQ
jgi:hypothetical protein